MMTLLCIVGSDSIKLVDKAIDTMADYIKPDRTITIPSIKLNLTSSVINKVVDTPKVTFDLNVLLPILQHMLDAKKGTGLDTVFKLSNFLSLDSLGASISKQKGSISDEIHKQIPDFLSDYTKDIDFGVIDEYSDFDSIEDLNIDSETNDAKQKAQQCIDEHCPAENEAQEIIQKIDRLQHIISDDLTANLTKIKNKIQINVVCKVNNSEGLTEVYNKTLRRTFQYTLDSIFQKAEDVSNLAHVVLDSFSIDLITNPCALIMNLFVYNFGIYCTYTSISLHCSLLAYFFVGLALKMRMKHLADTKNKSAEDDDSFSDDVELDNFSDNITKKNSKTNKEVKHNKRTVSDSESSDYSESVKPAKTNNRTKTKKDEESSNSSYGTSSSSNSIAPKSKLSRKNSKTSNTNNQSSNNFWLDYA